MNHSDDADLRAEFASLREHDATHAPEFDAVRRHAESRESSRSSFPLTLAFVAAAAVILVAATVGLYWSRARGTTPPLAPIAEWVSPTSSLLPRADRELLTPPPLLSSVLDGVSTSALQRKGD